MSGNHARYKYYRNEICKLTRISKKLYYHEFVNNNLNNLKKTWEGINGLLSRKKKTYMTINNLKQPHTNITTNSKLRIPNILNEHFTSVGPSLGNKLPPFEKYFTEYLDKKKSPVTSFFFTPISPKEIKLEILSMPQNKSYGFYSFPVSVLKDTNEILSEVLSNIFNKSIELGTFPSKLKMAKVIPIFKSDDETDPNNYRPISLLSCFNRIFEKLVFKRLKSFINERKIICSSQYGFRQGHSKEHAILDIVNAIQSNMDAGKFSCGVFVDLKKAFDTIDHSILLQKLAHYGFQGLINDWFRSYLQERAQVTMVGNRSSNKSLITCGVPQGSVLGPLLFLLYVNDIYCSSMKLKFYSFADDTNVLHSHKDLKSLEKEMNAELNNVYQWLVSNKLTLNLKKTNFVIFCPYQKPLPFLPTIYINDHLTNSLTYLESKDHVKYLGVHIDYKLSWKNHIDSITMKLSKTIGLLSKIRHFVPFHTLVSVYNSLVVPYLRYGLIAWGQTGKTQNAELNNVYQWLVSNKLTLNLKKTNFVIFRPYQKPLPFLPTMYINDHLKNSLTYLESKDHLKYLGVHINYKLSWKNHIDSITMKLSKTIGLLSKIRHFVPFHTLVSVYNSLVVPYLRYGLIAWGQTGKTQLNKLLILQKRALRFMCFADRCDHAIPLFLRAQTLAIHFLYYKLLAETMHDVSNDVIPSQLKDLFIPTVKIHSYNT